MSEPELSEDQVADLLRGALSRQAQQVKPSADGLSRIKAQLAQPVSGPDYVTLVDRPHSSRRYMPLMAAAAVVALMLASPMLSTIIRQGLGRNTNASAPTNNLTAGPSNNLTGDQAPGSRALPVYFKARSGLSVRLVREFHPSTLVDPQERISAAVQLAVSGSALDPDYSSAWTLIKPNSTKPTAAKQSQVRVSDNDQSIEVWITADGKNDPSDLALAQVVWTATATAERSTPVSINIVRGGNVVLTRVKSRTDYAEVRAPIWANSVNQGDQLSPGAIAIHGDLAENVGKAGNWRLYRVHKDGRQESVPFAVGAQGNAEVVDGRRPWQGTFTGEPQTKYKLVMIAPGWTDTKVFTVS